MPIAHRRRTKTDPYDLSRSLMRYRGAWSHGTAGLPTRLRDRRRQYARKPARCQRMIVSGLTIAIALRTGKPAIEPNKQKTIGIVEVRSFRRPSAKHIDLLP